MTKVEKYVPQRQHRLMSHGPETCSLATSAKPVRSIFLSRKLFQTNKCPSKSSEAIGSYYSHAQPHKFRITLKALLYGTRKSHLPGAHKNKLKIE